MLRCESILEFQTEQIDFYINPGEYEHGNLVILKMKSIRSVGPLELTFAYNLKFHYEYKKT
jgi:hypothetical protein